jgi:hypothetical protein
MDLNVLDIMKNVLENSLINSMIMMNASNKEFGNVKRISMEHLEGLNKVRNQKVILRLNCQVLYHIVNRNQWKKVQFGWNLKQKRQDI